MNEIAKINQSLSTTRTSELIAAEINNIKEQTRKMVLYNSIEIGRRLVEAKEIIVHGEWGHWLEISVDYSQSTANNLIRIFEEYGAEQITLLGDNAKCQALGNLSYTQAIMLLGIPEEEREGFIKENDIDNMSTRELKQAIKEKQEVEERLKAAEEKLEYSDIEKKSITDQVEKLEKSSSDNASKAEKYKKELADTKNKYNEQLTNKEVEIANLNIHIKEIKKQIDDAKAAGEGEEVEKLQQSLQDKESQSMELEDKIKELEEQLKEKPIEVNAEIPEDIKKELEDLRNKVKINSNETSSKFKVYFDELVKDFNSLLTSLGAIENPELEEKYKNAVIALIEKIQGAL